MTDVANTINKMKKLKEDDCQFSSYKNAITNVKCDIYWKKIKSELLVLGRYIFILQARASGDKEVEFITRVFSNEIKIATVEIETIKKKEKCLILSSDGVKNLIKVSKNSHKLQDANQVQLVIQNILKYKQAICARLRV
ncbi:hypothetical protein RF11_11062 [Thelohanellus kitauei]|uniref:Uncharacterized protein n=1 Tax=Thelohanellus kitauei TaxID=669202 RepID=A0A0C2JJ54_THEKT|nr:hypothetical protein RF11_11062 [Thelohanellus kitauei]